MVESEVDLSTIIPAYNAMPYLKSLVDSIMMQLPLEDGYSVEVIIVDDGSTDDTGRYCDAVAHSNSNVIVFHQNNSGSPAGPRNIGIKAAKGRYLFFADADDPFFPNSIRRIIAYAYEKDLCVGVFEVDASDYDEDYYRGLFDRPQDGCTTENSLIMNSLGPYKLFKRSLVLDNNIAFPLTAFEDLNFTVECYMCASRISIVVDGHPFYKYRKRPDGIALSQEIKNEKSRAIFMSQESRAAGIMGALERCARKYDPSVHPRAFARFFESIWKKLLAENSLEEVQYVKRAMEDSSRWYTDEVRSVLPFSSMMVLDSLYKESTEDCLAALRCWPDGPSIRFLNEESLIYEALPAEDLAPVARGTIPFDKADKGSKLMNPHVNRNLVVDCVRKGDSFIFRGRFELLRKVGGSLKALFLVARIGPDREVVVSADLQNLLEEYPYGDVLHAKFGWSGVVHCGELARVALEDERESSIAHFYLRLEFEGGTFYENRFGHSRSAGVFSSFAENAVMSKGLVFAPTETSYGNLSLNIYRLPSIECQNAMVTAVEKAGWGRRRVFLQGDQGFDCYPGTKVVARCGKVEAVMSTGGRRSERLYRGVIVCPKAELGEINVFSFVGGGRIDYGFAKIEAKRTVGYFSLILRAARNRYRRLVHSRR